MTGILGEKDFDTEIHKEVRLVMMEAETGLGRYSQGTPRTALNHQKLSSSKDGVFPGVGRESMALPTPQFWTYSLQN